MSLPKINKTYNYFDDGKIKKSRQYPVTITDIIPFNKIDNKILSIWKEDVESCNWLYAKNTDYFIKGSLNIHKDKSEEVYFNLSVSKVLLQTCVSGCLLLTLKQNK